MEEISKKMEQIVFPVVRVRHAQAGGSGTVLYSDEEETFAITNNHVIEGAVIREKYWDPYREKDKLRERTQEITVEFFDWEGMSKQFASEKFKADLVMRDSEVDLALLRFSNPAPYEYTAKTISRDRIKNIKMFESVWAVGASLGHEPIPTKGHIMYLPQMIDNHRFVMACAPTIYGNSGGAEFRLGSTDDYEYIGVPSRLNVILMGFSADPLPHMSYFIHPEEIYNFTEEWFYDFILDDSKDKEESREKREKKIERKKDELVIKR